MVEFKVYTGSKSGAIAERTTTRELKPSQVLIKVTHSGLCGTDVHAKHAPIGLGHEGAGIVEAVGDSVTSHKVGDRVGWGYLQNSCGKCRFCSTGMETMCDKRELFSEANRDQGSMATHGVWEERFVFSIPEAMKNEDAAPLMCGGATVFSALRQHNVQPQSRVGVIGIGGLGHLAIQFAAKMGCEVVVFSGTDSKREEAMRLGAKEFHAMKGVTELKLEKKIDHLIITTSALPDWKLYMPALARCATLYPLSVDKDNISFPSLPLIQNGWRIQGSLVAARQMHRDMLEFAAYHGIKPIIETFPLNAEGITEAFDRLDAGKMRYRGVLVAESPKL